MTEMYHAKLRGDIPSVCKNGIDCYSTNYGSVHVVAYTGKVVDACIGFSNYQIDGRYKHFTIRIRNDSYSIRTGTIYQELTETASSNYPYKLAYVGKTNLALVFDMIRTSGKLSRAIIAVVLTLRQLIDDKLSGDDRGAMDALLVHISQNYSSIIYRQPILQRVPIICADSDSFTLSA